MNLRLFLLLAGLFALPAARAEEHHPTLALGNPAPDFSLPGVDGRNWSLKDFAQARVLVVIFTAVHCPTAQHYEERIKRIAADYSGKGAAVVAIMPNDPQALRPDELGWSDLSDSFPEMKIRAEEHHFNFPYLYDGDAQAVAHAYGPVATPHAFVFDAARKLRYAGGVDDSERPDHATRHYLRDAIEAVLEGKNPPMALTKVIGCSTKWSEKRGQVKAFLDKLDAEPVALSRADTNALQSLRRNDSGKLSLVNFWATWCAPCLVEFDGLVSVSRIYRPRDLEFVSVSLNSPDEEKRVLEFLTRKHASNRNLLFGSNDRESLINAFNPAWQGEVPYTVLLGPKGEVLYSETGSIDFLALKRAIVKAASDLGK